jgi:TatD DNase family protein
VIDSHTHIDKTPGDAADIVAAATQIGVRRILTVGTEARSNQSALEHCDRFAGTVYAAVGHHPNNADSFDDDAAAGIDALADDPRVRAIGETGLDYFREYASKEEQMRAFRAHVEIARRVAKPLVIHTRAAEDDTIDFLAEHARDCRVIMHCFSMPDRLSECLELGWFISFAGNVTYPNAPALAEAAEIVPLDRLLVETDAPYLTPQVVRKQRNQTAFVTHTAEFIAERRGITYGELEQAVEATAADLFGW